MESCLNMFTDLKIYNLLLFFLWFTLVCLFLKYIVYNYVAIFFFRIDFSKSCVNLKMHERKCTHTIKGDNSYQDHKSQKSLCFCRYKTFLLLYWYFSSFHWCRFCSESSHAVCQWCSIWPLHRSYLTGSRQF